MRVCKKKTPHTTSTWTTPTEKPHITTQTVCCKALLLETTCYLCIFVSKTAEKVHFLSPNTHSGPNSVPFYSKASDDYRGPNNLNFSSQPAKFIIETMDQTIKSHRKIVGIPTQTQAKPLLYETKWYENHVFLVHSLWHDH